MTTESKDSLYVSYTFNGSPGPMQAVEPDMIAMMIAGKDQFSGEMGGMQFALNGFRQGRQRNETITIGLPYKCSDATTLTEDQIKPGEAIPYEKLPENVRKEVEARIADYKKMFKDAGDSFFTNRRGDSGNSVPPPR